MAGRLGSGKWKQPGRRTVDSCPALDLSYLSAKGWLQPGTSDSYPLAIGDALILLDLRIAATADGTEHLCLSWRPVNANNSSRSPGEPSGETSG